jgi:indolepyruvate ferredoxin oxidoreductase alpha subunit
MGNMNRTSNLWWWCSSHKGSGVRSKADRVSQKIRAMGAQPIATINKRIKAKQMIKHSEQRILMGNEAIGRGLVEEGCTLAAAYPGTPASEILSSVVAFAKETGVALHTEWSVNEKVACETALANSMAGRRSAVAMKQVGLNVAADPFTRATYLGVRGGFILIAADDPGPHSSQTEQDSRLFAHFAKAPVFDPSSPREAREMVAEAFALSEKYEIPVVLRPTTRVCHARQNVSCRTPAPREQRACFEKNPGRWVATPQFLTELHSLLNGKLDRIAQEPAFAPVLTPGTARPGLRRASGVAFAQPELLDTLGPEEDCLYQVRRLPAPPAVHREIGSATRRSLSWRDGQRSRCSRRRPSRPGSATFPGRADADVIEDPRILDLPAAPPAAKRIRPSLCAGCARRPSMRSATPFPRIFPSDIGCYTLGMNFGAVDTCHCMAPASDRAGFTRLCRRGSDFPTIVVTIGDSTFFHAGIPGLINAVFQGARFILVILDNATTAMTGGQPTPQLGVRADGRRLGRLHPDLVGPAASGTSVKIGPYDVEAFTATLEGGGLLHPVAGGRHRRPLIDPLHREPCGAQARAVFA